MCFLCRSVADVASSSYDLERARRPPTPSRYGAGGMAEDEGMLPPGLTPEGENDDDIADGAAALFGIDLGDGDNSGAPVHIDLEGDGSGGVGGPTATVDSAPSRAKMRGLFNVLQIMQEKTGNDYTAYYAKVRTELFKLFNKYDEKYGSSRTQRRST